MFRILGILFAAAFMLSCATHEAQREISSAPVVQEVSRTYEIYGRKVQLHDAEVVPPTEAAAIQSLNDIMSGLFKKEYSNPAGVTDPATGLVIHGTRRGVHPRAHGCAIGEMKVNDDVKPAAGIFQPGAKYDVTIRFSNGSPMPTGDDRAVDTRGFAMKVHKVSGLRILPNEDFNPSEPASQDFTVNSTEPFFADDAEHYSQFMKILTFESKDLKDAGTKFVLKLVKEGHPVIATRVTLAFKKIQNLKATNPLGISYYSITPFQHGSGPNAPIVKYKVEPCGGEWQESIRDDDKFFLRTNLVKHLASKSACFKFMIQPRVNPDWSVENPSVAWPQKDSPYREIARIQIPQQSLMDDMACEKLVINPWNGLAEHKPLGGINRIRLPTYLLSVQRRRETNHY